MGSKQSWRVEGGILEDTWRLCIWTSLGKTMVKVWSAKE